MTSGRTLNLPPGYSSGILSGLTWGIDTTLLAIALALSAFYPDQGLLLSGSYICAVIHIFFETIVMNGVVAGTKGFSEVWYAARSKGGIIAMVGGLAGGPIAMTCYLMSLEMLGAPISTTITSTYPLIGAFIAFLLLREHTNAQIWIGAAACVFGILYTGMGVDFDGSKMEPIGFLLALVTAIGWGFEAVACRKAMDDHGLSPKAALLLREYTCLIVYLLIAPLFLSRFGSISDTLSVLMHNGMPFVIVAIASCFGAFSMFAWYKSISKIGATRGVCLNSSYCIWTIIFVSIYFGIEPNSYIVTGAIITLAGIFLALWPKNIFSMGMNSDF